MTHNDFDFNEARNYWRFAPSGKGKIDSSELMRLSDAEFQINWLEQFNSRKSHYWEERRIIQLFAEMFRGKHVLSFGSGLGLNEMQFVRTGARLVCADIVPTNLQVIEREARLEGHSLIKTIQMEDSATEDFGGPYDYIYANGSLMTMPFSQQKQVMENFKKALNRDGRIILMLYTWKFVEDTCGVDSAKAFALRSDPSVGDIHNPWSDWHDDKKLMELAGAEMVISGRQLWNQDYYAWYGLDWAANYLDAPREFLQFSRETAVGEPIYNPPIANAKPLEAKVSWQKSGGMFVETTSNNYSYAAWFDDVKQSFSGDLELFIDADLQEGAFSIGVLDVARDKMISARVISRKGHHFHIFPLPAEMPAPFRVVLSNFREGSAASSKFVVHDIAIVRNN